LTLKTVNIYGFFSIALMIVMLLLIWTKWVPGSWFFPMFVAAFVLFLGRVALRLIVARQSRRAKRQEEEAGEGQP
jgi:hypothetical protein